jgi:serine-type D-Ala-D-Ala carboxypeptidase (penicillin-binding protein 5/6)
MPLDQGRQDGPRLPERQPRAPRRGRAVLVGALLCVVLLAGSVVAAGQLGWLEGLRLPFGAGEESPPTAGTAADILAPSAPPQAGRLPASVRPPAVKATAWLIADEETGQVLAARNPTAARPMASTTKVMTALLVIEDGRDLGRTVAIGAAPTRIGDASLKLRQGERFTVRQLLQGLLLKSANDAAVALAEAVDGSEAAFVRHMNARAKELGLKATRFVTPHGLDQPGHHTSPRDLARLWEAAMRQPAFRELVGTRTARLPGGPAELRAITTTNQLLGVYPWLEGGKTGFTNNAGRCLVASAERGGRRLVAVALGSTNAFTDVRALLEYGFTGFVRTRVADAGEIVTVKAGPPDPAQTWRLTAPIDALVRRDLISRLTVTATGPPSADGTLPARVSAGSQELARVALAPASDASATGGAAAVVGPGGQPRPLDAGPVPAGQPPATIDPFLVAPAGAGR